MNFHILIFMLIASLGFVSCLKKNSSDTPPPPVVFTRQTKLESLSDSYHYPARVKAKVNAVILSESDAIVSKVATVLGKKVSRNQTLLVLSHTDPIYQYAPVQIRSPITGIVSSIDITQGSHVIQGQRLASVIDPSQLEVEVEVPAQDLPLIKKGIIGDLKIPSREPEIPIRVSGVSPFVDPGTGTALVQLDPQFKSLKTSVELKDGFSDLSPGMLGQVVFKLNPRQGFLIPDNSVIYKGKNSFVRIVESKKLKQIPVVLGKRQRGMIEILNGLSPNVQLVERASRFIAEDETVQVESDSSI